MDYYYFFGITTTHRRTMSVMNNIEMFSSSYYLSCYLHNERFNGKNNAINIIYTHTA